LKTTKYHFIEKESDITIISDSKKAIQRAIDEFYHHRRELEKYIECDNEFLTSFSPVKVHSNSKIIKLMSDAAEICHVGPMAAVAGALADVMIDIMKKTDVAYFKPSKIALVENGGEIAVDSEKPMSIALYAGDNDLNLNLGFLIEKNNCPIGLGTSSATIGHAISLGQADAVTTFAENASIADASATYIANLVKGEDIEKSILNALDAAQDIKEIRGVFISRENKIGQAGKLPKLIKIDSKNYDLIGAKLANVVPDNADILK